MFWHNKQHSYSCSQFAKSLVSQAHLCPLPLHVCPVYWAYDCGLRLYPLPDLVVCADKFDPFTRRSADCSIMNPVSTWQFVLSVCVYCFGLVWRCALTSLTPSRANQPTSSMNSVNTWQFVLSACVYCFGLVWWCALTSLTPSLTDFSVM